MAELVDDLNVGFFKGCIGSIVLLDSWIVIATTLSKYIHILRIQIPGMGS